MENKPVRVLVTAPLGVGGITSLMINVQSNIDREKVNFDYLVLHDRHEDREDAVLAMGSRKLIATGDNIRFKPLRMVIRWNRQYQVFKKNHIQIYHLNGGPSSDTISAIIAKMAGVKHVTFHSHNAGTAVYRGLGNKILSDIFRPVMPFFIDEFWACSTLAAQFSFPQRIVKQKKFTFILNGIDLQRFCFDSEKRSIMRQKLDVENKFVVGHAGRFNVQKNHMFLTDIFAEIYKKDANAVLLLCGVGELQKQVKQKVKKLGLENAVIFYGASSEMENMYQAMDVFVMPSLCEGLPVAGVEAQVSGLPLILSDKITHEVAVLESTEYISLETPAVEWAEKILKYKEKNTRGNYDKELELAGFDEKDTANFFEQYYLLVADKLG